MDTTMETVETLKAARKLITPKHRWTQGQLARSAKKRPVKHDSPKAVCWCAIGAVMHVKESIYTGDVLDALRRAMRTKGATRF